MSGVVVLGAGGHARVTIATLRAAGTTVWSILDDDASKHGTTVDGVTVRGPITRADLLSAIAAGAATRDGAVAALCALGDNAARRRAVATLDEGADWVGVDWVRAVHPAAIVHPGVLLGAGSVVFAGAVIQPGTTVGAHAIVNTAASVDHDCAVGDFVHVGPGAHLCGGVTLGKGALLGVGCSVIPGVRIGAWATVGAGAAVVRDVPEGATVVGVPARALARGSG